MKTFIYSKKVIFTVIGAIFVFTLTACSDEEKPKPAQALTEEKVSGEKVISVDSPHDKTPEADNSEKQKFEHDFAAQCVERELNNSANNITDAERINKSCQCIADYIMKDLTDEEAEKFNTEHEHPQSLRIKFEAAAYECLQEKAHVAGPKFSGKSTE